MPVLDISPTGARASTVSPTSITVDAGALGERTFAVDERTFIRVLNPGVREKFETFAEITKPGMRLVVVRDGERASMLRKAAEG